MVSSSVLSIEHAWLEYDDRGDGDSIKYIIGRLSVDLPRLTSLNIAISTYHLKNPISPGGHPAVFRSLRSLTLRVIVHTNDDLAWVTMLLDAAPLLDTLQTEVFANEKREHPGGILWEPAGFEHLHLRQVKMYQFRTGRSQIALARLLLSRAPLLRTMTLFRGSFLWYEDWKIEYLETDGGWSREQQSAVKGRLAEWNTSGARLEFMP
ncbi:unnamed protein product [Urochloa humidicola]